MERKDLSSGRGLFLARHITEREFIDGVSKLKLTIDFTNGFEEGMSEWVLARSLIHEVTEKSPHAIALELFHKYSSLGRSKTVLKRHDGFMEAFYEQIHDMVEPGPVFPRTCQMVESLKLNGWNSSGISFFKFQLAISEGLKHLTLQSTTFATNFQFFLSSMGNHRATPAMQTIHLRNVRRRGLPPNRTILYPLVTSSPEDKRSRVYRGRDGTVEGRLIWKGRKNEAVMTCRRAMSKAAQLLLQTN